jgi:hypothetical protein
MYCLDNLELDGHIWLIILIHFKINLNYQVVQFKLSHPVVYHYHMTIVLMESD